MKTKGHPILTKHINGNHLLVCPICESERVFLTGFNCRQNRVGWLEVFIKPTGLAIEPSSESVDSKLVLSLCFTCEARHKFVYSMIMDQMTICVQRFVFQREEYELPQSNIKDK